MIMHVEPRSQLILDHLDTLVLCRVATSRQPPSNAELARALRSFAPSTCDDVQWAAQVAASMTRLMNAGSVDVERRAVDGTAAVAARFGCSGVLDWKRVQDRIVPGLALDVAADDAKGHARLKSREAWLAAVIGRARGLWTGGPPPSLSSVADGLVWQALDLPGKPGRNPKAVRAHFVAVVLGSASGSNLTLERRAALLAAQLAGAVRADLAGLREALVRRWLQGLSWTVTPATTPPLAPADAATIAWSSTEAFANAVRLAASRAQDGRFGPRKVFIAALWRDASFAGLSLAEFKARLLVAHRAGLTALVRADLVGAMPEALVRDSELVDLDSVYHFVETETP
jgi:hypothetical protein